MTEPELKISSARALEFTPAISSQARIAASLGVEVGL
jgi:hypothetical protein